MAADQVIITNREIYDSVQELKTLAIRTNLRLDRLEERRARSWQVWALVISAALAVPMSVIALIVKG